MAAAAVFGALASWGLAGWLAREVMVGWIYESVEARYPASVVRAEQRRKTLARLRADQIVNVATMIGWPVMLAIAYFSTRTRARRTALSGVSRGDLTFDSIADEDKWSAKPTISVALVAWSRREVKARHASREEALRLAEKDRRSLKE